MRKEISTRALWVALVCMLSTAAFQASAEQMSDRRPDLDAQVENLFNHLFDRLRAVTEEGIELLAELFAAEESQTLETSGASSQADPVPEIPTSEAGYPQIDPNG